MNVFYIYDKTTGEYIGKRETTVKNPVWQSGVEAVRKELIPLEVKNKVSLNPEHFKRVRNRFVEFDKKEKAKRKVKRHVDVH